jgi:DNA-binding CsgD family transcriptional regulator
MPFKPKPRKPTLTPRQREIVRLVSLGCSTNEIAEILEIAASTIENHKAAAMKILKTDKAVLMARLAIKHKISSMTDTLTASEKSACGRGDDGWN